jgi:hypothetical protein
MALSSIAQTKVELKTLKRFSLQPMMKIVIAISTLTLAVGLSGCSSYKPLQAKPAWMVPNFNTSILDASGIASVHCAGGVGCQFVSLNGVQLLNPLTGEPTERSKSDAILRFETPATSYSSQYYLALPAAPHDVEVLFFPVSHARVESFTLTNRFKAGHRYDLKLYRQEREQSASLLSLAGPAPLCIDLLDDGKLDRRFCRNYGFQTMTTEFLEQKVK